MLMERMNGDGRFEGGLVLTRQKSNGRSGRFFLVKNLVLCEVLCEARTFPSSVVILFPVRVTRWFQPCFLPNDWRQCSAPPGCVTTRYLLGVYLPSRYPRGTRECQVPTSKWPQASSVKSKTLRVYHALLTSRGPVRCVSRPFPPHPCPSSHCSIVHGLDAADEVKGSTDLTDLAVCKRC